MERNEQFFTANLIRHAESEFNLAQSQAAGDQAVSSHGKEDIEVKFKDSLLDAPITKHGHEQCQKAAEVCKDKNIKLVIVSPLQRALETCNEIFKNHKNKPKVIVHPLFREMCLSNCDIGSKILECKERFSDYDFSFLEKYDNPKIWVLYEIAKQETREQVLKQIKDQCKDDQEFQETAHLKLLEIIKNLYPKHLEYQEDTNERSHRQKKALKELAIQHGLKSDEELAMVGHSRNLQAVTATKFGENGAPLDGRWLDNCEVYPSQI